jgi:hypothetical protein
MRLALRSKLIVQGKLFAICGRNIEIIPLLRNLNVNASNDLADYRPPQPPILPTRQQVQAIVLEQSTMIISRLISMTLRFAQSVCAAVVLAITSYLLYHQQHKDHSGSYGRLIYSTIIAIVSIIASLIWLLPTTSHIVNVVGDVLFCSAWCAVFGLLQDWYTNAMSCGSTWAWNEMGLRNGSCSRWNAAQAFGFLNVVFWFASFALGMLIWRKTGGTHRGGV